MVGKVLAQLAANASANLQSGRHLQEFRAAERGLEQAVHWAEDALQRAKEQVSACSSCPTPPPSTRPCLPRRRSPRP